MPPMTRPIFTAALALSIGLAWTGGCGPTVLQSTVAGEGGSSGTGGHGGESTGGQSGSSSGDGGQGVGGPTTTATTTTSASTTGGAGAGGTSQGGGGFGGSSSSTSATTGSGVPTCNDGLLNGSETDPWGSNIDNTYANYACLGDGDGATCTLADILPVGLDSPKGDGLWGQADLAGNMSEWVLDWFGSNYINPCVDCFQAAPAGSGKRVFRGGGFSSVAFGVYVSTRFQMDPAIRNAAVGIRCARIP